MTVVFFDGECNLCNSSVKFILARDRHNYFYFSSLQSGFAKKMLDVTLVTTPLNSIVLFCDNKIFLKSDAALEIARRLSGLWPAFYFFKIVPRFVRDLIYDVVATHRYRWFGKTSCLVPTPELRARFLE